MHRTQIQLEEWQYELLVGEAESKGTSLADIIRTAVSEYFERHHGSARHGGLSRIAGIAHDAEASGREHDRLLYERPASPAAEDAGSDSE